MTSDSNSTDAILLPPGTQKLAVLFSGSGRTLQNLGELIQAGELPAEIVLAIGSNEKAGGHDKAARFDIPSVTLKSPDEIWAAIKESGADLVVLAGFMKLLPIDDAYAGRVLNIHPSLLPSFGGKGMFAANVHQAVLEKGCKISGCTVHFCDNEYDTGPILVQRSCPVLDSDTVDSLAARVFTEECLAYPEAIRLIAEGRVRVENRVARVLGE